MSMDAQWKSQVMCKSLMSFDNELDIDDNKHDDDDHDDDIMITYVDWGRAEGAEQQAKTKCHACATCVFLCTCEPPRR